MFTSVLRFARHKLGHRPSTRPQARKRTLNLECLENREVLSATAASLLSPIELPAGQVAPRVCYPVMTPVAPAAPVESTVSLPLIGPAVLRDGATSGSSAVVPEINSGGPSAKGGGSGKSVSSTTTTGDGYVYYRYGSQLDKAPTSLGGGLALVGGGKDVDQVFTWMGEKARGGDFLLLGTTGKDVYDSYIYKLNAGAVNSVSTLVITSSAAASNPVVLDAINQAEAIFIEGGDQSTYLNLWQDNAIEDTLNAAVNTRKASIGGTSAGLAVLGEYVFSAANGTATSSTVLANPYDTTVTLDTGFLSLPFMANTITDSHFYERDRMGRFDTFLARLVKDSRSPGAQGTSPSDKKGIAIDEETAVLVDTVSGLAQVVANKSKDPNARHAYFLKTTGAPQTCEPGVPLTFADDPGMDGVSVQRASANNVFDLDRWAWADVSGGPAGRDYTLSAVRGVLSSSIGSIY